MMTKRLPGWAMRVLKPPRVVFEAVGPAQLTGVICDVWGPRESHYVYEFAQPTLASPRGSFYRVEFPMQFAGAGQWDKLPYGRYWTAFYADVDEKRVLLCTHPFRIYDANAKWWDRWERVYLWTWVRLPENRKARRSGPAAPRSP
jgi:hypothetical protein